MTWVLCLQPTDDIVLMAQALEKIFLQKVAQMPQEEVELLPPVPKGKGRKPAAGAQSAGKRRQAGVQAFSAEAVSGGVGAALAPLSCVPCLPGKDRYDELDGADLCGAGRILLELLSVMCLADRPHFAPVFIDLSIGFALLAVWLRGVCLSAGESQGDHYPDPWGQSGVQPGLRVGID